MENKRKALESLKDKDKLKVLQSIDEKKDKMSPEAFSSYKASMLSQLGIEEGVDDVEVQANEMRERLKKIRDR